MKYKKLTALLCALLVTFLMVGSAYAETDDELAELLETWAEEYEGKLYYGGSQYLTWLRTLPQNGPFLSPTANDFPQSEALEIAVREVLLFVEKNVDFLAPYRPYFAFSQNHEWFIGFAPRDLLAGLGVIDVSLDKNGELREITIREPDPRYAPGPKG